jgi:hypothetical protein
VHKRIKDTAKLATNEYERNGKKQRDKQAKNENDCLAAIQVDFFGWQNK